MTDMNKWRHIFKLDPAKPISDEDLMKICTSDTDAIMIGGTDDITEENVAHLMHKVKCYSLPIVLELSNLESVVPGFDLYFIPTVLNSRDVKYHNGLLLEALKSYGTLIDFNEVVFEGYVVLNPDCKVAKLTQADTMIDDEDIEAYAQKKLHNKNADVIIANNVGDRTIGFSSDDNDYTMYYKNGDAIPLGKHKKVELAEHILNSLETRWK